MKILAVDDDPIFLSLLNETVFAAGFKDVTLATSAKQAAQIITSAKTPFDCFFLDIQMPEIDGIELCHWIRRFPGYQSTPILMITAMIDKTNIDRAFAAGASDYITKPIDALELTTRVRLAEKLNTATRDAADSISAAQAMRAQFDDEARADLSSPVPILDVNGFIEFLALENYLLQLSRGGMLAMTSFAFKIPHVETIYAKSTRSEFIEILTDVAGAISDNLRSSDYFAAYAGNGVFVCVANGNRIADAGEMEAAIGLSIEAMELAYNNGDPLELELVMGEPLRLGLRSGRAAVNALYSAIENAEIRCRTGHVIGAKSSRNSAVGLLKKLARAV